VGHLFITGTYRSGTTLVEKLFHAFGDVSVASQPLPLLYIDAKRSFLASRGIAEPHPLGHLFGEDRYQVDDLGPFLHDLRLSAEQVQGLLDRLAQAPGFWSPELLDRRDELTGGSFSDVRHDVTRLLAEVHGRPTAQWKGSKEVICEEFVPFLLGQGERVVLVVRDPRAVLRSIYLGAGATFSGRVRPVLFHLRMWRKSVAIALAHQSDPGVAVVRYEDLLADPKAIAASLAELVGLDGPAAPPLSQLRDQHGRPWGGNSSFAPGQTGALSADVDRYVEAVCHPELVALGYPVTSTDPPLEIIEEFTEPAPVDDPALPAGYSSSDENVEMEVRRLALLRGEQPVPDVARWFIHEGAFARLREAVATQHAVLQHREPA
jgi:hypothetical protein